MDRSCVAEDIAGKAGFKKGYVKTADFTLMTYQRFKGESENIRVYIEGDGRAWEARNRLSDDPTPSNPVALKLAAADPSDNVVYIARPGQFTAPDYAECDPTYWSGRRFAPEVVDSLDKAIDILKEKSGAKDVELIGYSGGAAIAVIIAAGRSDVTTLRTIAGNLDHIAVNRYHNVSPLEGSLNPIDFAAKVSHIPQRHFVSAGDSVIPKAIAESFAGKIGDQRHESITIVEGTSHTAGWQKAWPSLVNVPLYKQK